MAGTPLSPLFELHLQFPLGLGVSDRLHRARRDVLKVYPRSDLAGRRLQEMSGQQRDVFLPLAERKFPPAQAQRTLADDVANIEV